MGQCVFSRAEAGGDRCELEAGLAEHSNNGPGQLRGQECGLLVMWTGQRPGNWLAGPARGLRASTDMIVCVQQTARACRKQRFHFCILLSPQG